jgi:hypothetical protein
VFWIYLGIGLWLSLSVPFGLLAGAAIRGRHRKVIDVTDTALPSSPALSRTTAAQEQLTDLG